MRQTQTQCMRIISYMKEFGSISTLEAFQDIGCTRLASRICDLKHQGYNIGWKMEKRKNRYGYDVHYKRYFLRDTSLLSQ